jgi:hypothetical protein
VIQEFLKDQLRVLKLTMNYRLGEFGQIGQRWSLKIADRFVQVLLCHFQKRIGAFVFGII